MTAEWVYRQMIIAKRVGTDALRTLQSRRKSRPRRRLICRAEEILDETCPQYEDRFLCVLMSGGIPTAEDNVDTDVRVELLDITEGVSRAEPVLSVSGDWRLPDSPVFFYRAHNGVVPCRNAVLAGEVTVAKIPLHLMRFAHRGRRKLQITLAILARSDGDVIAQAQACMEYVFYSEGFVEMQERRENILRACIELACASVAGAGFNPRAAEGMEQWVREKLRNAVPRSNLTEPIERLKSGAAVFETDQACECLLAWGQKADRLAAMDLALQIVALYPTLSHQQEEWFWTLAEKFQIPNDRFQGMCQHRLLTEHCPYERWRLLLGVRGQLLSEELRRRLNEEYRKWNSRVTHSDPRIRHQADILLSLVAEVRNRQEKAALGIQS